MPGNFFLQKYPIPVSMIREVVSVHYLVGLRNSISFVVIIFKLNLASSSIQGRSQNLKKVPQNFIEVFNTDDVTANNII